jgi:DNA-binding MarR family transcriptional regulator
MLDHYNAGMATTPPGRTRSTSAAFDSLEQEAYLQLWRTYDRLRELDEQVFQRHGLTAQQYNALRILASARPGALSTSAVGARLVSRAADMTRLLDKLEERGLVVRRRCQENRRVVFVSITAAGVAVIGRLAAEVRRLGKDQLGHLDRRTLRTMIDILARARAPHEDALTAAAWPRRRQPGRGGGTFRHPGASN